MARRRALSPAVAALVLMLGANAAAFRVGNPDGTVRERRLALMPDRLAGYDGKEDRFDEAVLAALKTDDQLNRLYLKTTADFHWLYVGYYGTAKGGRTGHVPHHCFRGSGFTILDRGKEIIPSAGGAVRVNRILVKKPNGPVISCLYWFQSRNEVLDSGWDLNWKRFRDRLREGRDDGAFVRVLSPLDGSVEETVARQRRFAGGVIAALPAAWPVEERPAPLWSRAADALGFLNLSGRRSPTGSRQRKEDV